MEKIKSFLAFIFKKRFVSIKLKISILTSAIAVFCLFAISFIFLYNSKIIMQKKTLEVCRNFAENIANVVREDLILDGTYEATNSLIHSITKSKFIGLKSIYIINVYGKFVVNFNKSNLKENATESELSYFKKIQELDLQEVFLPETKQNILRITFPIFINYNSKSLKIGAAIFEYDRDEIYQPIYELQNKIILIGFGITILTLFITFFLSSYITRPLINFSNGVQILASGGLEHKIQIESMDEVGILSEKFNEMSNNLRQSYEFLEEKVLERTAKLNESLSVIRRDLAVAETIQSTTLSTNVDQNKYLDITVKYIPMTEVGGDFYSISNLNETTSRIFLADATGHGVQAALVMMAIQGIYDSIKYFTLPLNEIMENFNKEFIRRYGPLNTYLTCILMEVDTINSTVKYSSAGHPAGILIEKDKKYSLMPKTGPIVGAKPNGVYKLETFPFLPEDRIFIFTDGIFEQFQEEEEFGEERLYKILVESKDKSCKDSIENALTELDLFLNHTEKQDDITILGINYKSKSD